MIDTEHIPIQQLWYTWSDVGLSSVHAGFRVRAASSELTEIYTERVKSMDRYMRYALPPGANRGSVAPKNAPVGLSFLRTGVNNEAILVHKNYSGEDGVGRPGNFFVHLLALGEASSFFTAEDAIWLWDADLWKSDPSSLDRRTITLDPIPLARLDSNPRFHPQFAQIRPFLPFFIEAFLTRKGRAPLYVAAPAHQASLIACLIVGLTQCLPRQFLADLTFSTYEPDITKATTDIVGTSWISTPGQEEEASQQVLPSLWYRDHLAINCQTGVQSQLQGHPQITYHPLAASFAREVTECLMSNTMDQFYDLCALAEKNQDLTIDLFLQLYNSEIANTDSVDTIEIERYLSNPVLALDRLQSRNFRKKIVDRVRENPQWSNDRLLPILERLCQQATREYSQPFQSRLSLSSQSLSQTEQGQYPGASSTIQKKSQRNKTATRAQKSQLTLAETLTLLAQRAIPELVDAMKKGWSAKEIVSSDGLSSQKKTEPIVALLNMMHKSMLDALSAPVWQQLFDALLASPTSINYLNTQWSVLSFLLPLWNVALPVNKTIDTAIYPLLQVPWSSFGVFLKVSLQAPHRQWISFSIEHLLRSEAPSPQVIQELERQYASTLSTCLLQLIQEADFALAANFLQRLSKHGFRVSSLQDGIIEDLFTHLSSQQDQRLWLTASELVTTLLSSGYSGPLSYQQRIERFLDTLLSYNSTLGYTLLDGLAAGPYPRKNMLVDCLNRANTTKEQLYKNVQRVYRTPKELNTFFLTHATSYLQEKVYQPAMITLYKELLSMFPQEDKMERLFICLDVSSLKDGLAIDILSYPLFEIDEKAKILERYGQRYLKEASTLAVLVVNWFVALIRSNYSNKSKLLFKILTLEADAKYVNTLLEVVELSLPDIREFFIRYGLKKDHAKFFLQESPISQEFFSQLAQTAQQLNDKQMAEEKMALVFAWLNPSDLLLRCDNDARKAMIIAGNMLRGAFLEEEESSAFLEKYGVEYLSRFPNFPTMHIFIAAYMKTFTLEMLDKLPSYNFLTFLADRYESLPIDVQRSAAQRSETMEYIRSWSVILSYYYAPSANLDILKPLTTALYMKNLPNSSYGMISLARVFVRGIITIRDLHDIIDTVKKHVPTIEKSLIQFLYILAEEAAKAYSVQGNLVLLLPYLLYALQDNIGTQDEYFRHVFLDTLLHFVEVYDLAAWSNLHLFLGPQLGSANNAQRHWQSYLTKLELWNHLSTTASGPQRKSKSVPKLSRPSLSLPFKSQNPKKQQKPVDEQHFVDNMRKHGVRLPPVSASPPQQEPQPFSFHNEEPPKRSRNGWF